MARPVRIGINILYLIPGKAGGLETVFRNILAALRTIDTANEYTIFTNRETSGSVEAQGNVHVVTCPVNASFRPGKHAWEQVVFPFWLKRYNIDILLSPGNVTPFCSPCPSITVINDAIPFVRPENFTFLERSVLKALFLLSARRSSAVLTLSESAKGDVILHLNIPQSKVHVFPLAAEDRFHPAASGCSAVPARYGIKAPYLICIASSRPYKNIGNLIRAFAALKREHGIPHQLVITGLAGRAHDTVRDLAAALLAREDIVFAGFVPDCDLPELYSCAIASIYPSLYEGFGLPVLESMACGTPVISSNAASLPEVIGDAGVLFDPRNIDNMSASIYSVISSEPLRQSLREKGLLRARLFSWNRSAKIILDLLLKQARQSA
ncbi:MAG: glycosyltransferase family 4 protein [Nitrospirota bacterium]